MQLVTTRDTCGLAQDSRDFIRLKMTVQSELRSVMEELDDLARTNNAELGKRGSKLTPEEVRARKELMASIAEEYHSVFKRATGYAHEGSTEMSQAGAGMSVLTKEQVSKGAYAGAGIKMQREEMSGEHMQQLAQINEQVATQDKILSEIEAGVQDLTQIGLAIHDVRSRHLFMSLCARVHAHV